MKKSFATFLNIMFLHILLLIVVFTRWAFKQRKYTHKSYCECVVEEMEQKLLCGVK